MKIELNDWLTSINQSKINIMDDDSSSKKDYPSYIINRCLSGTIDTLMYANEMNKNPLLDKKLQYDFLINIVRTRKRYSPWIKQEKLKDLEVVKSYYSYSNEKAKQALRILSEKQLNFIKSKLETGGLK
jgi:hypothetical protein